ncbi:MAG: DUF892 family protein [Bacteroidetes bacterium]|nr:MAG: DUF892 family protein [Bacteroidota bacterium]
MSYREKLQKLFIQHFHVIYDGETVIIDTLNKIMTETSSENAKEVFALKMEKKRENIYQLEELFFQMNLPDEGDTDDIIRPLLNANSEYEEYNTAKAIKFIFSRALSLYYTNAYQVAIDCAFELGNEEAAIGLSNCLKNNRQERTIFLPMNKMMENSGVSVMAA